MLIKGALDPVPESRLNAKFPAALHLPRIHAGRLYFDHKAAPAAMQGIQIMKRHLLWLASALVAFSASMASAHLPESSQGYGDGYGQQRMVRCESTGSRSVFCRVDSMGQIRIARQLSNRACIQGRSWAYNSRGIYVSQGCRAIFAVGRSRGYSAPNAVVSHTHFQDGSGRIIHCESTANGRNYCGDAHSRYSMSGNRDPDCIEGQTWGHDSRGVWVSGDCDADFSASSYDRDNGYGNNGYDDGQDEVPGNAEVEHTHYVDGDGQVIHCQSTADGRNYCGDRDSRYIISGTRDPDCIEGETYGRDSRGTWVSGDCDAQLTLDNPDGY